MTATTGVVDDPTLLRAWEAGESRRGADRVLAVLAEVFPLPELVDGWAQLPLGRRDALLLALHGAVGGPSLTALADCAGCADVLEVQLAVDDLLARGGSAAPGWYELDLGTATVRARPPSSADVLALTGLTDVAAIRAALVDRCVAAGTTGDPTTAGGPTLTDDEVVRLAAGLEALDPLADIRLDVVCAVCTRRTEVLLDVPGIVWARLRAAAGRVVRDVHALATRYGWAEADILAMTPARRRTYLDLP